MVTGGIAQIVRDRAYYLDYMIRAACIWS